MQSFSNLFKKMEKFNKHFQFIHNLFIFLVLLTILIIVFLNQLAERK